MKTTTPVVHCIFSESQVDLSDLLKESFRLYLRCTLAMQEDPLEIAPSKENQDRS